MAWESDPQSKTSYKVEIFIEALDRLNLLVDVVAALSECGADVLSSSTASHRDGMADMRFLFQVSTVESIDRIIAKLESIDGVIEARRMMPGDTVSKK